VLELELAFSVRALKIVEKGSLEFIFASGARKKMDFFVKDGAAT
jgi:hypothetical protein